MKFLDLLHERQCPVRKLVKELGVGRQTIYNWDNHHATPNPKTILMIKDILGVSAERVLECFVKEDDYGKTERK